ncbi:uncharacterized protein LOC130628589 [Hydractinia symbiolongicarpus]|uniref:uncharacterized protein LOC130628589 n=1 Tax=Hydractinia symbiolongicarpus TaxID=13093 RepID=UPI00254CB4C2|nr:uncharacterized protein LOC130628589 [Hydractinia symbiolongicarpus]XP_057297543.1 uncharacterized protein LOC130628589 [Hydractinia symbiolongicarpus]
MKQQHEMIVFCFVFIPLMVSSHSKSDFKSLPDVTNKLYDDVDDTTVLTPDEQAAEELVKRTFITTARKVDNGFYYRQRKRHLANSVYKKDDFPHGYHFTIPNDFIVGDYKEDNEPDPAMQRPSNPLLSNPHPVVENAQNMETQVSNLIASAGSLKMQSVQLESKAKELEKQAEILHAQAGGPHINFMETPVKAPEDTSQDVDRSKSGEGGKGPERGGYASSSRPLINGQTLPGGAEKAPATPTLGPPTFEKESPTQDINTGYPMYQLPARSGEYTIPVYHKPLPPLIGPNPYEVLTSSSLNGTAYKIPSLVPALEEPTSSGIPLFKPEPESAGLPLFKPAQKYIISLKGLKPKGSKSEKAETKSTSAHLKSLVQRSKKFNKSLRTKNKNKNKLKRMKKRKTTWKKKEGKRKRT